VGVRLDLDSVGWEVDLHQELDGDNEVVVVVDVEFDIDGEEEEDSRTFHSLKVGALRRVGRLVVAPLSRSEREVPSFPCEECHRPLPLRRPCRFRV